MERFEAHLYESEMLTWVLHLNDTVQCMSGLRYSIYLDISNMLYYDDTVVC